MPRAKPKVVSPSLAKVPTGIQGLDEVTGGGLPKGRVTLVCGSAGCGKSLLAMEFLVHGAIRYGEPGVCMDFEETEAKLAANVASLGFDLRELAKRTGNGTDFHAAPASRQVPGHFPRHRRVSVPDRSRRPFGTADHLPGTCSQSIDGPRCNGNPRLGRDDGRQGVLPWKQCAGNGHGGSREIEPGGEFHQRRLRPRRTMPVFSLLKSLPARFSVTCARLALTWSRG